MSGHFGARLFNRLWMADLAAYKTILLVDDETDFLTAFERSFAKHSDSLNVLTANSGQEAINILSREAIDLIVADFHMPEITGLDLLYRIRSQWPKTEIVIMTGYCSDELKKIAEKNGCRQIFEKPFSIAEARTFIFSILKNIEKGFSGIVKSINLSDLIQMCCLDGASKSIRTRKGSEEAYIHIRNGEIIDATCGEFEGEEAFFKILGWTEGSFETLVPTTKIEKTIFNGWQYLLMEGARRIDEAESEVLILEEEISDPQPVRLMIVDDSAIMVRALTDIFSSSNEIMVVGSAPDGEQALKVIDELKPDIMTLDINMPVMTGGTALRHIMIKSPCPVVIVSSITDNRSRGQILEFLRLGALDFLDKPKNIDLAAQKDKFISTIRRAARAVTENFKRSKDNRERYKAQTLSPDHRLCKGVLAINSGPGGHAEAIKLITSLPAMETTCCILLQSMPDEMMDVFASHMDCRSYMEVLPLYNGAPLLPGKCYLGSTYHAWRIEKRNNDEWLICNHSGTAAKTEDKFFQFVKTVADSYSFRIMTVLLSGAVVSDIRLVEEIAEMGHLLISLKKEVMMVADFLDGDIDALVEQLDPEKLIQKISEFE